VKNTEPVIEFTCNYGANEVWDLGHQFAHVISTPRMPGRSTRHSRPVVRRFDDRAHPTAGKKAVSHTSPRPISVS
jgi:hypothetical protein